MATVNYPELLPHPLVKDGYGFRIQQNQAVGLFDVETQSRDETRSVNVAFTFTDLQYKVFHGWFMNTLIHGQKWFNMRLDGEFFECTFGGSQPQYSLNRKIITVTATLKTRPNTGFVNYTNQRVTYPDVVNYMPSPFDPSGWSGASDPDISYSSFTEENPSGESFVGRFEYVGPSTANILIGGATPFLSGDNIAFCFIVKPDGYNYIRVTVQERPAGSNGANFYVNLTSGEVESPSGSLDFTTKITELSNGYFLVQALASGALSSDYRCVLWMQGISDAVQVGEALKLQAAYFGKADDYPAKIIYEY